MDDEAPDHARSTLAFQPRRPVPWGAADLLLVVIFFIFLNGALLTFAYNALGPQPPDTPAASDASQARSDHVVLQLLREGNAWAVVLCAAAAVVVAPIVEEFFFRVLLLGWFEAVERRWRRKAIWLRRLGPRAVGPICLSALLFAGMHFRVGATQIDTQHLIVGLSADSAAKLLMLAFAIWMLRWRVGATAADLGWNPKKLLDDVRLGLIVFAVIVAPIYLIQFTAMVLLPKNVAPDPIPLFFLAVVFGFVYYRTRRIVPVIVAHAALNATSLVLAWLMTRLGS